jgi:hypothetical protein
MPRDLRVIFTKIHLYTLGPHWVFARQRVLRFVPPDLAAQEVINRFLLETELNAFHYTRQTLGGSRTCLLRLVT